MAEKKVAGTVCIGLQCEEGKESKGVFVFLSNEEQPVFLVSDHPQLFVGDVRARLNGDKSVVFDYESLPKSDIELGEVVVKDCIPFSRRTREIFHDLYYRADDSKLIFM